MKGKKMSNLFYINILEKLAQEIEDLENEFDGQGCGDLNNFVEAKSNLRHEEIKKLRKINEIIESPGFCSDSNKNLIFLKIYTILKSERKFESHTKVKEIYDREIKNRSDRIDELHDLTSGACECETDINYTCDACGAKFELEEMGAI